MRNFAGKITWKGNALDPINEGTLTLPTGETHNIRRETRSSMVKVHNGPFFTGSQKFILVRPEGEQVFETFDDLMMKGLEQPRIDD